MAFGQQHVLGFSPNGKLFALINDQGILRIWDTETNELKQEYTPNLHLAVPCTALLWVSVSAGEEKKTKKARKSGGTQNAESLYLALGTSNGKISLYSYAQAQIERTLKGGGHSGRVTALTLGSNGQQLYSCGEDCRIIEWSLAEEKQLDSWSIGNEKPYSLAFMEHSQNLVVGTRQIKVFSVETHDLVQTFTGHTSDTHLMASFVCGDSVEYAVTASRMERILCLWKIGKKGRNKSASCTLLMDSVAQCLSCQLDEEGNLRVASVTNSGVIHVHVVAMENIKAEKPLKPKVNIQIVSDSTSVIAPIPAVAASVQHSSNAQDLIFCYGDAQFLVFERLTPNFGEKMQVLTRVEPKSLYTSRKTSGKKESVSSMALKTLTPIINAEEVDYKSSLTVSKKKLKSVELPMESRLQNLNLNAPAGSVMPQAQSKVQLLVQSLHSKDAMLLRSVLHTHDTKTIQLTLQKLPVQYVGTLVNELTLLMQQKRMNVEYAIKWLKVLAQTHSSQLMALGADDLLNKFGPCLGIIEHRANCLKELSKLNGRLQLLVSQIKRNTEEDNLNSENALVYEDNDSSNSEIEDTLDKSASDDEWEEQDDDDDDGEDMDQDDDNDDDDDSDDEAMET